MKEKKKKINMKK